MPDAKCPDSDEMRSSSHTAADQDPSLPPPVQATVPSTVRPGSKSSKRQSVHFGSRWSRYLHNFLKQFGPGTAPSSVETSQNWKSSPKPEEHLHYSAASVVEEAVVVDRHWDGQIEYETETTSLDEEIAVDTSGASPPKKSLWREPDASALNANGISRIWVFLRWQLFPAASDFFYPKGHSSEEAEDYYRKEDWFVSKPLARWAALWLICNWVLGLGFLPKPYQLIDLIFYCGVAPAFSFPIIIMVLYNWPRDRPFLYQTTLIFSVWMWSFYQVFFIYLCGQYNESHSFFNCNGRDFFGIFFYTTAMQTIALFGLKLDRLPAAIGAATFFSVTCALMIPDKITWVRSMLNFAVYHTFLIYVHYMRENAERRLHNLRLQVKMQYKATQRAQVSERKMSDSKYRLTSYVFHEVRVPLNAAVLAVQNMAASGTIVKEMEIEFDALKGSLETMSKVLNDVLDFNRIDSGNFESVSKPFHFHQAFTTLYNSLNIPANHKGLHFDMNLDPKIDEAARKASYRALELNEDAIAKHMAEHPDVPGIVVGDEARLRQIVSNLVTNAIKFTEAGGSVRMSTHLIPGCFHDPPQPTESKHDTDPVVAVPVPRKHGHALSESNLSIHNREVAKTAPSIIVRIMVTDTGCGISASEARKLFSPFKQAEQGRAQGGGGTGLGLSLVRSIVKLLGGRLGFSSHKGEGSTFWVELPLGVGAETLIPPQERDEESDASNDMRKVRAAARHLTALPSTAQKDALLKTVDAAALEASASWTSIPVHKSIFNQVVSMSDAVLSQKSGVQSRMSSEYSPIHQTSSTLPLESTKMSSQSPTPTLNHQPSEQVPSRLTLRRPPNVTMPSSFSISSDPHPTPSTDLSSCSNKMTMFDRAYSAQNGTTSDISEETPAGLSVLVVDDDMITRSMMDRMLKRLGCEVTVAENGKAAVQLIVGPEVNTPASERSEPSHGPSEYGSTVSFEGQRKFNVVFMDNQMPVMSGLQAIKFLRNQGRRDFVVGLTGNALLPDQNEYIEAGVDMVLTKPVLERQLKDVLRQADLRRKRGSRRENGLDHPP